MCSPRDPLLCCCADIKAGQGMFFTVATNAYRAVNCDNDKYVRVICTLLSCSKLLESLNFKQI